MAAPRVRTRLGTFSRASAVRRADGRTVEAKIIRDVQRQLLEQYGGESATTAAQRIAIHAAAVLTFRLRAACERYVMTEDIEGLDRHICALVGSLTRTLALLGLEHQAKDSVPTLAAYLEGRKAA